MGKVFGYARVSPDDHDMALQIAALEKHGVDLTSSGHASGQNMERKELKRVVKIMRRGDALLMW